LCPFCGRRRNSWVLPAGGRNPVRGELRPQRDKTSKPLAVKKEGGRRTSPRAVPGYYPTSRTRGPMWKNTRTKKKRKRKSQGSRENARSDQGVQHLTREQLLGGEKESRPSGKRKTCRGGGYAPGQKAATDPPLSSCLRAKNFGRKKEREPAIELRIREDTVKIMGHTRGWRQRPKRKAACKERGRKSVPFQGGEVLYEGAARKKAY